ncbi:hypothetical protein [Streptosporangium sp. KLBMP 9127]
MAVISTIMVGAKGALATGIGVLVVGAFFVISLVAVTYASRISPTMMMAAAMGTFFTKIVVLILILTSLSDVTAWDPTVFSWTVILCTVAWTFGEARGFMKLRILYVEPGTEVPGQYGKK